MFAQETESTSKPVMNATSALRTIHFLFFSAMLLALGPRQVAASSTSVATVIGLNNHQFEIQMKPDQRLTVSEALRMALGAPSPPNLKRVKIVRETPTGKKMIFIELRDLGTSEGRKRDIFIRPSDVILAPSLRLPPVP
jgi:hypothetical protein